MCVCIVCVYVCIHVMRVVRLRHKLTYCFFPFSWVDPTHSGGGGGGATNPEPGIIYIYIIIDVYRTRICYIYLHTAPCSCGTFDTLLIGAFEGSRPALLL